MYAVCFHTRGSSSRVKLNESFYIINYLTGTVLSCEIHFPLLHTQTQLLRLYLLLPFCIGESGACTRLARWTTLKTRFIFFRLPKVAAASLVGLVQWPTSCIWEFLWAFSPHFFCHFQAPLYAVSSLSRCVYFPIFAE